MLITLDPVRIKIIQIGPQNKTNVSVFNGYISYTGKEEI